MARGGVPQHKNSIVVKGRRVFGLGLAWCIIGIAQDWRRRDDGFVSTHCMAFVREGGIPMESRMIPS